VTGNVVFGDIVQISGVGGNVTVSLDRPPYRVVMADDRPVPVSVERARAQPSRLLLARHQVVPFTGRERTLDTLAGWISGDEPVAALLVHGAGGQGKSRLAAQVSGECAAAGWVVWQVTHTSTSVAGSAAASQVVLPGGAVVAVVDYADRWPASALLALLTQLRDLHTRTGTRVRVLMLARSDGYWWPALADRADSDLSIDVDQWTLPPLAADSDDNRPGLFATAVARFANALDLQLADWPVPDLAGPEFRQILAVHMAALATVDATRHGETPPTQPGTVSAYLLRREQAYWQQLYTRIEAPMQTPPEVMHRTVVAATLTGAQPRPAARQALADAGFADSSTAADQIIDDHATCYPPVDTRTVFEPLHPDRLGEDLIALSTPGHGHADIINMKRDWTPAAISGLLTAGGLPPGWAAAAITVLVETAHRWPHIATGVLYPLFRVHPRLAITAGGATLTRLTSLADIDPTILETFEPLLPDGRHIDLDIAAAAITSALTKHRLAHTTDPAEQARLHATHAIRLANVGRREQALAATEEAVAIRRKLAEANPNAYLPELATALSNLSMFLSGLGRYDRALTPAEEAVAIYRRLAEDNPAAYLPNRGASLVNLSMSLSGLGRRDEALAPAEEAVAIYRRLAEANPDAYLPEFATALNNLSNRLSEAGRRDEALVRTDDAATIWRRLAEANPDAYLPDLAGSLTMLGVRLSGVGRHDRALAPAEEAVGTYRRLAEAHPNAYLRGLAMALNNLSMSLSGLGRRNEALALAEEAVILKRRLAEANPDAYLSSLAASLTNLSVSCSDLAQYDRALALAEEATSLYRRLAEANPDAYLPELATALNNLGRSLSLLGRDGQALTFTQEALVIRRKLAAGNPAAYQPDLAASLTNLSNHLSRLGHREQALTPAEEATSIYRQLAEANPAAFLPDLAKALNNLGCHLSVLGHRKQALTSTDEAIGIRRQLAEDSPASYLPDLAASLWTYAWVCVNVKGRLPAALDAVTEAINLYKPLTERLQMFTEELSSAYRTLADVLDGLGRTDEAQDLRRQLDKASSDRQG
jgi:hypothetical protein